MQAASLRNKPPAQVAKCHVSITVNVSEDLFVNHLPMWRRTCKCQTPQLVALLDLSRDFVNSALLGQVLALESMNEIDAAALLLLYVRIDSRNLDFGNIPSPSARTECHSSLLISHVSPHGGVQGKVSSLQDHEIHADSHTFLN